MFVGLDLGTSGVKVLLIDENQHVVASADEGQGVARVHPGWSEQDPADWIQTTDQALYKLKKSHGDALSAVKGIGLSGQMHGATLPGKARKVLRPCILGMTPAATSRLSGWMQIPASVQSPAILHFPVSQHPSLFGLK